MSDLPTRHTLNKCLHSGSRFLLHFSCLADGVIALHKKGFLVSCNLAYGLDWSNPENADILNRELHKLIAFYLENPDIEPCSMLEMDISAVGIYTEQASAIPQRTFWMLM